jgi:hypothetical protein
VLKKAFLGLVVSGALVLGVGANAAFAGEITGNGKFTPVHFHNASSICSFSGQNDDAEGPNPRVQSYGVLVAAGVTSPAGPGPAAPGEECKGN